MEKCICRCLLSILIHIHYKQILAQLRALHCKLFSLHYLLLLLLLLFVVICNYASFDCDFTSEWLHRCGAAAMYMVWGIGLPTTALDLCIIYISVLLIWSTYLLFIIPFLNINSNVVDSNRIYSRLAVVTSERRELTN